MKNEWVGVVVISAIYGAFLYGIYRLYKFYINAMVRAVDSSKVA